MLNVYYSRYLRGASGLVLVLLVGACQNLAPGPVDQLAFNDSVIAPSTRKKINNLLNLMDQRLNVAQRVAKSKWNSGASVNDPKRELQILDSVAAQADALGGLNPALVRHFFQDQFDAGKIIQNDLLSEWRKSIPTEYKFDDAPDLARDIRPILDKLTPALIAALRDVQPILADPGVHGYVSQTAITLIRGDVNGAVRRQALRGLME
ncbi:gamma subclass chorismate mutase AroQ [Glaciimonas immobilis]|uniref:chorismate mutase n=1 Tax=Glaciimonas immobilis TaxID=728004 RepID=A0A840RQP5_9BURK|nr:gamma subclass chorismate mutase AroQ [Glaciimonas immobilis]KAF3999427.1 gamma subclass chorismate mutase AroQ [Glaciimonas immobilis]MBB5198931.1 chorismate mutase [Glaciimonas immobilis]